MEFVEVLDELDATLKDAFSDVTSDAAAGAVGRYVAAISKTTRRGYRVNP